MHIEMARQIFVLFSNIKFYKILFSGPLIVTRLRTDGQIEILICADVCKIAYFALLSETQAVSTTFFNFIKLLVIISGFILECLVNVLCSLCL